MVQDLYKPDLKNASFGDKLSDRFLGTNNVNNLNLQNNYELQKAINLNKYDWNKQGMLASGINPLIASSSLSSVSSSQATSNMDSSTGYLGNEIIQVVDMLNPVKQIREMKEFAKSLLNKIF